jgi:hypothetical protein
MKLEPSRDLEVFFSKKLKQTITHPFLVFSALFSTFDTQKTFVAFQFVHPMTRKSFNLVKE